MANTTITPLATALSLSIQKVALVVAGALVVGGAGVSMDLRQAPSAGLAGFAGAGPALTFGALTPATGALTFGGSGPVLSLNVASGSPAALSAAGVAPVLSSGSAPDVSAGSMAFGGNASQLAAGLVTPAGGVALLSGTLASVSTPNTTVQTLGGGLQLTGGLGSATASIVPVAGQWAVDAVPARLNFTITLTVAGTAPLALSSAPSTLDTGLAPSAGLAMMTTFGIVSPVLSPSAATLSLSGRVPSLAYGSPLIAPFPANVQIVGTNAGVTLSVPAAPAANLVMGGVQPQVLAKILASPSAGALQAAGSIANLISGDLLLPLPGAVQLSSVGPGLAVTINGAAGTVDIVAAAPAVIRGSVLSAIAGSTQFAGGTPTFAPGIALNTAPGALVLSGAAPTLLPALTVPPGSLALGANALTLNLSIRPAATALTYSGAAPTVNGQAIIGVPGAGLALTSATPVQGYAARPGAGSAGFSGGNASTAQGLIAPTGTIAVSSGAPTASLSGLVLSVSGSAVALGVAPVLTLGITPRVGAAQFASALPVVNSLTTVFTLTGSLVSGGDGSTVTQPGVIPPPTGLLGFAADQTLILRSGYAAPPIASLNLTTTAPTIIQTIAGYCTPGTAALNFSGQPAVTPLYEPDAIHIVTLTGPYLYLVKLEG